MMKKVVVIVSVLFLMIAKNSFAQQGKKWRGTGGWGMGAQYNRMYDIKTVESINEEIISVDTIRPQKGMSYGVHLTVITDKDTISVHLGPSWYIENQDVKQIIPERVMYSKIAVISY